MTTLRAPAPQTVMLHPSFDGRVYAPAETDDSSLLTTARLLAQRVLACAADTSLLAGLRGRPSVDVEAQQAEEAAALVNTWKALSRAQYAA